MVGEAAPGRWYRIEDHNQAAQLRAVKPRLEDGSMRLWSLHPSYLDSKSLVAVWREGLLARAVLMGETKGYQHHPQLERFRAHPAPISAINNYLRSILAEANERGYRFDSSKIGPVRNRTKIPVKRGQLLFEIKHLRGKIEIRSPEELGRLPRNSKVKSHPLFSVRDGGLESWEKGAA